LKRRKVISRIPDPQPSGHEEEVCPVCNGAHFVHPLKADGQPDYSRSVGCRHCITPEQVRKKLGVSSLDSTFDNFKSVPGAEEALRAAKLIASMETDWKLLLIYGEWGNGKTHLLEAISLALWELGHTARIQTFPDFVTRLKGTFDRSKNEEQGDSFNDMLNRLCTTEFLLLDDVGTAGSFTEFSLAQLEHIMLARYRENLFTVITTNLDYASLPRFVTSRFSDSEKARIVINDAPDYRPNKRE